MFDMTMSILAVIFIAYFNVDPVFSIERGCELSISDDFTDTSPLYVDRYHRFQYPRRNEPTTLKIDWFQDFLVYCPNAVAKLGNNEFQSRVDQPFHLPPVVRCVNGKLFEIEASAEPKFDLKDLQCSSRPPPTAWTGGYMCGTANKYHLGYTLDNFNKEIIGVCYDEIKGTSLWAVALIPESIAGRKTTVLHPSFNTGPFYVNIDIDKYYNPCEQVETLISIFEHKDKAVNNDDDRMDDADDTMGNTDSEKIRELVEKYIRPNKLDDSMDIHSQRNFLVKGHLIAHADQFYAAEQLVTYLHANSLPMWESINNGNWKIMEEQVRELTMQKGQLGVVAGGIGVLQLEGKDIYLGRRKGQINPVMPVPKILFKAVYSRSTNQGIVYLAINNPYVTDAELGGYTKLCKEYPPCRIQNYNDKYKGYMWCCLIWDFVNAPEVQAIQPHIDLDLPMSVGPII